MTAIAIGLLALSLIGAAVRGEHMFGLVPTRRKPKENTDEVDELLDGLEMYLACGNPPIDVAQKSFRICVDDVLFVSGKRRGGCFESLWPNIQVNGTSVAMRESQRHRLYEMIHGTMARRIQGKIEHKLLEA